MAKAGGSQEDQDSLTETGLVARRHLETPEATATLDRLSRDLMRTARPVEEIRGAALLGPSQGAASPFSLWWPLPMAASSRGGSHWTNSPWAG